MESKKDIRKRVLEQRNQILEKEWEEKSLAIYSKVITHPFFLDAKTVYCYVDYRREVGTTSIIEEAWAQGKRVAVPKIEDDEMNFYYLEHFSDLQQGYKGIMEPNPDKPANEKKALVILPGAAFDRMGNRIGYGKGFYDKFLCSQKEYRTMALCFECQMVDTIPADIHDVCLEVIITEENVYVNKSTE